MSQYEIPDADHKEQCPYDKTHMIMLKRFPYHLMKCRKNYVGNDYAVCPFNANHEIPRPELRYHMAHCADRVALHQDIAYATKKKKEDPSYWSGNTKRPKDDWELPPSEENWDKEVPQYPKYGFETEAPKQKKPMKSMTMAEKRAQAQRNKINYQRKMQGLPPLADEEFPPDQFRAPAVQAPTEKPTVFQLSVQQQQQRTSLKMAGIGRGRGMLPPPAAVDTQSLTNGYGSHNGHSSPPELISASPVSSPARMAGVHRPDPSPAELLMALGRGRGLGRGNPITHFMPTAAAPATNGINQSPEEEEYEDPTGADGPDPSPAELLMALDRGRGLGRGNPITQFMPTAAAQPEFIVPKVGAPAYNGVSQSPAEEEDEDPTGADDIRREVRRLKKKLKMIEVLEDKERAGGKLSEEESNKVSRKEEIVYQLESLSMD